MLKSVAKYVVKDFVKSYIDLVGIVLMLIGFGCFVLTTLLALYEKMQFAIVFLGIGLLLILLGYFGSKIFEYLIERI